MPHDTHQQLREELRGRARRSSWIQFSSSLTHEEYNAITFFNGYVVEFFSVAHKGA